MSSAGFLLAFALLSGDPAALSGPLAQIGGGIFGTPAQAQTITVAKSGGKFRVICGANCATEDSVCVSGSALASITDSSPTKPYTILVYPGVYDECVSFDDITDVSLVGVDRDSVIIRPTVTTFSSAEGGVVRFGAVTATSGEGNRNLTARISLSNLTVWNDAFSAPESAVQAGRESGPGDNNVSSWTDINIYGIRAIGNHDGIQWFGSRLTGDLDLPRIEVTNNLVISGADGIVAKGWQRSTIKGNDVLIKTNWCESTDTANLAIESGTVVCTTCAATTFNLAASGVSSVDNFYLNRRVTMGGGAGCPVNTEVRWVSGYTGATRLLTVNEAFAGGAPDTDCTYDIDAVKHDDGTDYTAGDEIDSPCTSVDWNAVSSGDWKMSCFHLGVNNVDVPVPPGDKTVIEDLTCQIINNDKSTVSVAATTCTGQVHMTPILIQRSTHRDVQISNVNARSILNTDLRDGGACATRVAGVAFSGDAIIEGELAIKGFDFHLVNNGDSDVNTSCIASSSTGLSAGTLDVSDVYCDIDNVVGGYTAANEVYLRREDAGISTLAVRGASADELITTSGTISGWNEACFYIDTGAGTAFPAAGTDPILPLLSSEAGVQIAYAGCRCSGASCVAAESFTLTDISGNPIGAADIACVDNATVMTWTDVRADAGDNDIIAAGTNPRANSGTLSGTPGDDLTICLRFNTTRF